MAIKKSDLYSSGLSKSDFPDFNDPNKLGEGNAPRRPPG